MQSIKKLVVQWITSLVKVPAAQGRYLEIQERGGALAAELGVTADPARRAELLTSFADVERETGEVCVAAFGRREQGMADGCVSSARLTEILAEVERVRATGGGRAPSEWSELEAVAGGLLDWLAEPGFGDHEQRAAIYEALVPLVRPLLDGDQPGEILGVVVRSHFDLAAAVASRRRPERNP